KIEGAERPVATLHRQLEDHLLFVRAEVLPKTREDFRLPRELYEFQLRQVGVDISGEELAQKAHRGFDQIQGEMQRIAARVAQQYDDFNFDAAAWTLTAHEARPGHELQFSSMVERGVSQARAIFAFNSVNAEGWGLYAEAITLPYMPDDGKLISLQLRLQRA